MRYGQAVEKAKLFAKEGPRVAAVLKYIKNDKGETITNEYHAAPGFMDNDTEAIKQVLLITPDGRLWTEHEKTYVKGI